MISLNGQLGELRFTVQVTRGDTGKVEEYEFVGKIAEDQLKELTDGGDPQHSGQERGD